MAQNHAGAMRLGGQAKERQLLQGAVFPVAKQTWPAKSHLRRRRFSAHRHLPHAQGRNHSPGPRLRLFRPASSRNQGEAVGKPDRQAWLRSHLAAHRQGGLKCKKERGKNQCLNALFLFRSGATKQSIAATKKKDGLLRCARNDANSRYGFATSRREASEALMNLSPKEGVGNAGCPLHPRPRVHLVVVERTRVTTSTPESPDVPARNGFNGRVGVWRSEL